MSVPIVKLKSVKSGSQDWCATGKDQEKVYSKIIGSRLAQAMAVRGWSQTDLADALGITNNTLGRIIAGQERLNMNICCRAMVLMNFEPTFNYLGTIRLSLYLLSHFYKRVHRTGRMSSSAAARPAG